ncbi:MAG: hypothetical protein JXB23_07290, partial [Candidatus Aminicenantes bacterium]|nr:hypothetical protein [Candidatus Aminicenantes bacterium]
MGMNILEMESEVKTLYFDAKLDICSPLKDKSLKVVLYIKGMKVPAEISPYQTADNPETAPVFIHVHASQPLLLKWKDKFCIRNAVDSVSQGEGQVLYPLVEKIRSRDL